MRFTLIFERPLARSPKKHSRSRAVTPADPRSTDAVRPVHAWPGDGYETRFQTGTIGAPPANLMAVADGVLGSIEIPPGAYELAFFAISQAIARNDGSVLGSTEFTGEITAEPVPEPGVALSCLVALSLIAARFGFGGAGRAARVRADRI
jgi:hypothetical protein